MKLRQIFEKLLTTFGGDKWQHYSLDEMKREIENKTSDVMGIDLVLRNKYIKKIKNSKSKEEILTILTDLI